MENLAIRPDPGTTPVLELRGVSKRFGATRALDQVDIAVTPGSLHALVGRNGAGKSTVVNIATGLMATDDGQVLLGGEPSPPAGARHVWQRSVACVFQHPSVVPTLSVAENLFLNRLAPGRRDRVPSRSLHRSAKRLLDEWGFDLPVWETVGNLNVEQRQIVEIARALTEGAPMVLLDEPTAQLEAHAIRRLFDRVRRLQEKGVAFLYISHRIAEIFALCERVTVLRNGRVVLTTDVASTSHEELVGAMVGGASSGGPEPSLAQGLAAITGETDRRVGFAHAQAGSRAKGGERGRSGPALELREVSIGAATKVSMQVAPGEIVGLVGLSSSGIYDLAAAFVGLRTPAEGDILLSGGDKLKRSVSGAIGQGVGYVPRDRNTEGLIATMSVGENIILTRIARTGKGWGWLNLRRIRAKAEHMIERVGVTPGDPGRTIKELSGGNQQKVVFGRALATSPNVLVLVNPTAGVDVESKRALYQLVRDAAAQGAGVVVVSDDEDEVEICTRVAVMFRGQLTEEFHQGAWSAERLVAAMEGAMS